MPPGFVTEMQSAGASNYSATAVVQSRAMATPAKKKNSPSRKRVAPKKAKSGKLPKDAVVLIVALHAKPGQELLLRAELSALIRPSRKEPGCLAYDLHASIDNPADFLFYEVWASRDAHTVHTRTPHFSRWNARKDTLLAGRESRFWKQIG